MFSKILSFFAEAPASIRGYLNVAELARVLVTAGVSGGGVLGVLSALQNAIPDILPPIDVSLATSGVIFITELIRRFGHGIDMPLTPPTLPFRSSPFAR